MGAEVAPAPGAPALPARRGGWGLPRPGLRLWLSVAMVAATTLAFSAAALLVLPQTERQGMEVTRARVDKGLAAVRRQVADDGDRALRLADEAELLAGRPALVEAFVNRDMPTLNELLVQARSQFGGCLNGCTSAIAIVDESKAAIAEQPSRPLYDYNQSWVVRNALRPNQPSPFRPQRGIDARRTPANPLADLGLFAAHPIVVDGAPVGAVVIVRVYNDGLMQELADLTGLDVAILTADSLIAGSRDVRSLFQPPRVRPPAQRLAPVGPVHQIGEQQFVAAADPVRSWLTLPSLATPMPTPPGGWPGGERPGPNASPNRPPVVATLFVGQETDGIVAGLERLRGASLLLLLGGAALAFVTAQALAGAVQRPVAEVTAGLAALAGGSRAVPARGGPVGEGATLATAFNTMQAVTSARHQYLDDERRKLEAVIHSVTQGIIVLDDRARLVTVNETAQRLLGLPPGLPAGTDLATVLTPGQWDVLRPAVERRDAMAAEINLEEPRQAIVRVAAVPVHDDFARLLGRAVVLQDVTEERLLDNVKADFFTAMSHELRTPLSAIKGAAEVLLDDELPPTQRHFVQTIHRNTDRLSRLVTDLLDLSKLEAGRTELRPARADLNEIAADAVAALESVAGREGQRLSVRTEAETLPLTADPGRLEQIVTNLVSNALQYTPAGGQIVVSTWTEGAEACLAVSDDGVGISTVDQQHLFDKFYQGVNTLTHKRGGSGLGLAIVKQLTELHGGRIAVQSRLGQGSTFTVRLPIAPGPQESQQSPPDPLEATVPTAR
ncbi:MAG TPA: ATP-binding protein [Chloroflexota bacterium]|nr:ATP-binding protein [Chloroflexota bacterium]